MQASPEEESALAAVHGLKLHTLGRKHAGEDVLTRWTLVKAFLSSPEAGQESLSHRIEVTEKALHDAREGPHPFGKRLEADLKSLKDAHERVSAAQQAGSRKLARLISELRAIGFGGPQSPRVVIFSERIRTLEMLTEALARAFRLKPEQLACYTASGTLGGEGGGRAGERARRDIIESFGHADSPLRLLLCSDAASEGVNLHHQCHHLFHYDVPWSIIRLTQRNGRIDRFGQKATPQLRYLVTRTRAHTADQRVIDRLIEKEREVERQLGDPGALLGLHDADTEEALITRGVARGEPVETLLPDSPLSRAVAESILGTEGIVPLAPPPASGADPGIDLQALLEEIQRGAPAVPSIESLVETPASLFEDDYQLVVAALRHLETDTIVGPEPIRWTHNPRDKAVEVHAPESFRRYREPFLPREAVPEGDQPYRLVLEREIVSAKLRAALDDEGRWPDWHLLWEQHPLVEWLLDTLASAYARGEAPLLSVPSLPRDQAIFLVQTVLYNRESEAVDARWLGLVANKDRLEEGSLSLDEVMGRVRLPELVNRGKTVKRASALQGLVPAAVAEARFRVQRAREAHVKGGLLVRVREETRRLDAWSDQSRAYLEAKTESWRRRGAKVPSHVEEALRLEKEHIARVQRNHAELLQSVAAAGEPSVRLAAVFAGE